MAQELGTGYIIISPSTKGLGKAIEGSISEGTTKGTNGADKTILGKIGGAFGKVGKIGVAATAAVGTAIVGLAAKGGFDRALNIERAQTKLKALGHDTKSVDGIMNDALASVKGTAFGLGDAASVAAGLVASGVKQGGQLQTVLKTVGDTAQIAGVEFKDMGVIFGKVAAIGKLQGDEMLQLMEAGIPVLQYLADHFQVTAEEAQKMVSDGKVSFEDFEAAMREHLGGAAKSAGDSFDGMLANIKAAFSRTGETIATPLINSMTQLGNKAIPIIDQIGGKVGELASQFTDRLAGAVDVIGGKMDEFSKKLETGEITIDDLIRKLGELAGGFTVLAAVGGNLDTIMGAFDQLGSITDGAASKVKSGIDNIKNAFMNGMDSLDTFKSLFNKDIRESMIIDGSPEAQAVGRITEGLGRIRDGLTNGIGKLNGTKLGTAVSNIFSTMRDGINSGTSKVKTSITSKLADIAFVFENNPIVTSVKGVGYKITAGLSSVGGKVKNALAPLGEIFGGLGDLIGPKLQGGLDAVGGMISSFFNPANFLKFVGIGGIIAALLAGLGMINESTGGQIQTMIDGLGTQIQQIAPKIMEWIQVQLPAFIASGAQILTSLMQGITENLPLLMSFAGELVNSLCTGLAAALPTLMPMGVQMLTTLITSLIEQIPLLLQAGMTLLQGLCQGILESLPILVAQIPVIIESIITALATGLPRILQQGGEILLSLINGLVQQMPALVAQVPRIIQTIVTGLTQNLPRIIQSGMDILLKLINGLVKALPQLVSYVPQIIASIVRTLASNLPQILQAGVQILVMLINGLIQAIPRLIAAIPQCVSAIKDGFAQVNWGDVGMQIINGIISGITGMAGALWDAAVGVAKGALDKAKSWLGIHSPSRRFRDEVGKMIGEGIAVGIDATAKDVETAGKDLVENAFPSSIQVPRIDAARWKAGVRASADKAMDLLKTDFAMPVTASGKYLPDAYGRSEQYELTINGVDYSGDDRLAVLVRELVAATGVVLKARS